jgi:2,4-dienoyl-CoA reductase (NADPH2)
VVDIIPPMLRPITIGHVTLRNRVVMGAMHTRLETRDNPVERMAAFMAARAEGEVGLILTEGHSPTPEGRMDPESPVFNDTAHVDEHRVVWTPSTPQADGSSVRYSTPDDTRKSNHASVQPMSKHESIDTRHGP